MHPSGEAAWPESLRPLYEEVASTPTTEAVEASARWNTSFADWVRGASLEERTLAQLAAWERLARGERGLGELLFLVGSCSELLWPYAAPPAGLLERLLSRQGAMLELLRGTGEPEVAARVLRESEAALSTVLTRYLKRHPDSLLSLVGNVPCTYDGRALRFLDSVEVDVKRVMASGNKAIGMLEQLRLLLPATAEAGRDKLAEYIRTRASRIPWQEASEVLAERLFALATSPDGRGAMRGFLACYPNGRKEPEWCARAGVLLARTLEVGGSPAVVENLCELLARFDAPPVDGLRGALGALVGSDFDTLTDLGPVRFVLDHCQANLRKGEPGLVLTQVWLEERLFRASVRKGLSDAFERRKRMRAKLEPMATGFAHLCWLAEECADLWPKLGSENRPGLDELAAWRDEVAERIARKPMPRKAAIEFFLWCAPDAASSEAELVVLSLTRTETDRRQVRRLKDHPSSRVRLRVRTLQRWFQGATGKDGAKAPPPTGAVGPASLTDALRHLHVTRAVPLSGRTWLRDRDLEELLFGAVSRVEADFSARYPERFREDTVELVDSLLEALSGELGRVKADLFSLLAQGQPPPLDFELTVRRVAERVVEAPKPSRRGRGRAAAVPVATEVGLLDVSTSWAPVVESVIVEDESAGMSMEDEVSRLLEAEALSRVEASDETALAEVNEGPSDGLAIEESVPAVAPTEPADEGSDNDFHVDAPIQVAEATRPEPLPPLVAPTETSASEVRLPDEEPTARSRRGRAKRGSSDRVPDSRTAGTEIAFIMSAEVDGFVDTERAVLVQVVKLEQRGEGQWLPHFKLGREMVDGLLSRTDSAYCLFLVPPIPRAECWLLPARLVRDLMDAQRSLTTVSRDSVARAARSLSQWWMGDFVNLWTGDERTAFLEHVSPESPNAPDFVVQCSFHSGTRTPKP
ncbi:hypothetical protein MFUL124B02_26545 [Myxococcus fulvus 124B02]|nr:hypothetical protein MFUL124B02_26545 [Myxococcus fulvus 124B02]